MSQLGVDPKPTGQKDEAQSASPVIDTSKMSKDRAAALELAEESREELFDYTTFAGSLFMGHTRWPLISPYPQQPEEDRATGDAFLAKMESFLRERVDPDAIDETGEIPQDVIDELARMGAFGIKVPKEYDGLGLSQTNYARTAVLLGSYCGNVTALLSAHQSIGVPQPLLIFGTEEQKRRFLPRIAAGAISAFALTEEAVGSDPARMETTAEPTPDGQHFILNGEKLWCTNGLKADLLVVMARTPDKVVRGKPRRQVTAFVVEANAPGVEIAHRCHFMGLKALYNGVMRFKDVKVPRENIIAAEGQGLRVALTTLNTGRLTLPASCVGSTRRALEIVRNWSNEREQWGSTIGKHGAIADKIAYIASTLFAMEAMTFLTCAMVDRKSSDIRLEAAMCKMFCTEATWHIANETLQIRGGRGYETARSLAARGQAPIAVERMLRDLRINLIFEGSSEIMRLFIAREALDPHLKVAAGALDSRLSTGARLGAAMRAAAFYATWYPRQWLPFGNTPTGIHPDLDRHARFVARGSRKLARRLFHAMMRHGAGLEHQQVLLTRFVEIGAELFAIAATVERARAMLKSGSDAKEIVPLADFFCRQARLRIDARFRGIRRNHDRAGYKLAQRVLDGQYTWMEEGTVGRLR
ncbi:MAG: acyl-CoA dehydrogenase family protein [Acidobacteriota bacterium]|nr:acyl-CoA dehydrogenase family protein [Acidobacteriota bacterium]